MLLVSALYLAFIIGFQDWVIAKLVGLVIVVGLGIVALKRGARAASAVLLSARRCW